MQTNKSEIATRHHIRIVKVGGSLFEFPDLPSVLTRWIATQSPAHHVLIAGGGRMAEQIREIDRARKLNAEAVHWACIGLLTASARLLAAILPESRLVERINVLQQLVARPGNEVLVFAVEEFLRNQKNASAGFDLPAGWEVTSDSIAASLAVTLQASELVLLKSTDLPARLTRGSAADAGLVDAYFPIASQCLPAIRWVNLRNAREQSFANQ
jgi:aspartokinase-like uncharacterized kinase